MKTERTMKLVEAALQLIDERPLWGAPIILAVIGPVAICAVAVVRWATNSNVTRWTLASDLFAITLAGAIAFACAWWVLRGRRTNGAVARDGDRSPSELE